MGEYKLSAGKKMGKPVWGMQVVCRKYQGREQLDDPVERLFSTTPSPPKKK